MNWDLNAMYLDDAVTTITEFDKPAGWMYLDEQGRICIGAHHLLPDVDAALEIPFCQWNAARATREEIRDEYERVKELRIGLPPMAYRSSESLLIARDTIAKLLRDALVKCAVILSASFPNFGEYPDAVKVVLLDMCYDVGVAHLPTSFCEAIGKQNWALASTLCYRDDVVRERNDWARNQLADVTVAV